VLKPDCLGRRDGYKSSGLQRGRNDLPEVYVHSVKGRTPEQKRGLIKDITEAVVKNYNVPVDAVLVQLVESEPTEKAKGGVLFSEMRR